MEEQSLRSELDKVTLQLSSARTEYAILAARIAGLEASHAALGKALLASGQPSAATSSNTARYRTDAIVGVLRSARREMSIDDVVKVLRGDGRAHVTADSVGVDLAYLAEHGRVTRVRRGVYAFEPPG